MALNKEKLVSDIEVALTTVLNKDGSSSAEELLNQASRELATAIDSYVRSGQIMGITTIVAGAVPLAPPALPAGTQVLPVNLV